MKQNNSKGLLRLFPMVIMSGSVTVHHVTKWQLSFDDIAVYDWSTYSHHGQKTHKIHILLSSI